MATYEIEFEDGHVHGVQALSEDWAIDMAISERKIGSPHRGCHPECHCSYAQKRRVVRSELVRE